MGGRYAVHIYLTLGIAVVLGAGTLVPPLTTSRDWFAEDTPEMRSARREMSYCQESLSNVDCACFASKAGHVLAYDGPRLPATSLMNRSELARGQATDAC